MGRHVQRHDLPSKVDGTATFALDVRVPNMLYATVKRAPTFGGGVDNIDDTLTRAIKVWSTWLDFLRLRLAL